MPNRIGLINCDAFANEKPINLTTLRVKLKDTDLEDNTDLKLVFTSRRSAMSPNKITRKYVKFKGIPKDAAAWIVGLKMKDEKQTIDILHAFSGKTKSELTKQLKNNLPIEGPFTSLQSKWLQFELNQIGTTSKRILR